jgi:hypothetical protein
MRNESGCRLEEGRSKAEKQKHHHLDAQTDQKEVV